MYKINLFVEDFGHETFLDTLIRRFASEYTISVEIGSANAVGGYGKMIKELKKYISDLQRSKHDMPDLIVAATDGNCKGYLQRRQEIDEVTKKFHRPVICAIPDPHIERWLLLDSTAFKNVLGTGCAAPAYKCERDLYKRLLLEALQKSGSKPLLEPMEYARPLVNAMNLEYLERTEESLGKLLKALRQIFREWKQSNQKGLDLLREGLSPYVLLTENPQI